MRSIFTITMILFLLTACGAAAPTAKPTAARTATIPPTFCSPTETSTPTATATQLPEGTRIAVDTSKENWVEEFLGLEKYVKVDVEGKTTLSFAGEVLLDVDGKPIELDKTEFYYTPEDTVFTFAQQDRIWVGAWEFVKDEKGEYKLKDVLRILAPRPDANGNIADPALVLPHINKEDNDLMNLFISQIAIDVFRDDILSTQIDGLTRSKLTPDHYIFRVSEGYIYFFPAPLRSETGRFQQMMTRAYPSWLQNGPSIYINGLGTLIIDSILDNSQKTIHLKCVINPEKYAVYSKHFDKRYAFWALLNDSNTEDGIDPFITQNNAKLIKYVKDNNYHIKSFSGKGEDLLNSTIFLLFTEYK
jgi:hypothetical protein